MLVALWHSPPRLGALSYPSNSLPTIICWDSSNVELGQNGPVYLHNCGYDNSTKEGPIESPLSEEIGTSFAATQSDHILILLTTVTTHTHDMFSWLLRFIRLHTFSLNSSILLFCALKDTQFYIHSFPQLYFSGYLLNKWHVWLFIRFYSNSLVDEKEKNKRLKSGNCFPFFLLLLKSVFNKVRLWHVWKRLNTWDS